MRYRSDGRFDAAVLAALALVVLGAILGEPALFVAGAVPVAYVGVGALTRPPAVESLTVERSFDPDLPAPGQRTEVTVTVHNEGDRTLPDVRVVDRLPGHVPVVDGSPRGCLSVRPGESASFGYTVVASQGDYEFDPPLVRLRPLAAVGEATGRPPVAGDTTLRCRRGVGDLPQVRGALRQVGTQPTDRPGAGLEFHSVREYRHGDDVSRVDWRRLAKTGDLSTVNFREPHATKTVVVVDGREAGRVARADGHPTGAELSAYVADRAVDGLLAAGNQVGLAALGVTESSVDATLPSGRADRPWVPVGDDAATRARVEAVLDTVVAAAQAGRGETPAPDRAATDGGTGEVALRERLPGKADVVLATPALDDAPVDLVDGLAAAGHAVLVVAPDVTGDERPGARVAGLERRLRIQRLRESGATVVDWDTDRPLSLALEGST